MKRSIRILAALSLVMGCGGDDDNLDDAAPVLAQYAAIVHESYEDSIDGATALKTAIDAFVAAPSETTLTAARNAWIAARAPYLQTEVYRFYEGPIDMEPGGVEGALNGWPINEAWIDYVVGAPSGGIINDTTGTPTLSDTIIRGKDGMGDEPEKNLTTGYHPIEFLLWGQDLSETGPGARPYTDYVTTGGTAENQARRGEYLRLLADMLLEDLHTVEDAWHADDATSYAASFVALDGKEGVRRILQGMYSLSNDEMTDARLVTPYETKDQEEEHSCFSDTTLNDAANDELGIENVYLGRWGSMDGAGIEDLVRARDADLDARFRAQLAATKAAIAAIPAPFDQAILGVEDATSRAKIQAAIEALRAQSLLIKEIAELLGIELVFSMDA